MSRREAPIDRDGNHACAHRAEIGDKIVRAIGRQNRDTVAALVTARYKGTGDGIGAEIELTMAQLDGVVEIAGVNERGRVRVAIAIDKIAEIA